MRIIYDGAPLQSVSPLVSGEAATRSQTITPLPSMSVSSFSSPTFSAASATAAQSMSIMPAAPISTPSGPHPHDTLTVAVAALAGLVGLATLFLGGLFLWRRRRLNLQKERQLAIQRMTFVAPSKRFRRSSSFGTGTFFRTNDEIASPRTLSQVHGQPEPNFDERSVSSSQKGHGEKSDRMVLVNGVYVVALDTDDTSKIT